MERFIGKINRDSLKAMVYHEAAPVSSAHIMPAKIVILVFLFFILFPPKQVIYLSCDEINISLSKPDVNIEIAVQPCSNSLNRAWVPVFHEEKGMIFLKISCIMEEMDPGAE